MGYSQMLRQLFPGMTLGMEDLFLLEAFQIAYLPERVPVKEFATLLHTYPVIQRFLHAKYPAIDDFIHKILKENLPVEDKQEVEAQCQEALWEIADLILYNKHPEMYNTHGKIGWNAEDLTGLVPLEGKVVADVGAGSGRISFLVAPFVQTVFAVEPVTSFRSFMKEKARKEGVGNLFVMDGTLDSVPLPDQTLDILFTSNAIGWNLLKELKEIERVIKPGGYAIHLIWSDVNQENPYDETLTSPLWNYTCSQQIDGEQIKLVYLKELPV